MFHPVILSPCACNNKSWGQFKARRSIWISGTDRQRSPYSGSFLGRTNKQVGGKPSP